MQEQRQAGQAGQMVMYLSTSPPSLLPTPFFDEPGHPKDDPEKELQNWSSLIGIVTAIIGNILIALALNVQRYAHIRLHRQRLLIRVRVKQAMKSAATNGGGGVYGATAMVPNGNGSNGDLGRMCSREIDLRHEEENALETDPLSQSFLSGDSRWGEEDESQLTPTYLKDPYWWLGQVLITVGEMGNFLAYGFAPASIVSPLGVVALISNCVIAPMLFKEVFRTRDAWGVVIAVAGAVTVVLSANQKETKLEPHDVWLAITTMEFEIYLAVSCSLIVLLMWASPRYGNRTILIDLGLVGLFGGYTALSTKGVSSMLSSTLFGAFTTPVTYLLILVLLSTAVMQVRYVNKSLQRFDSTQVIPIQFVLFTLSVIIGSAVLYRDFERTTKSQALKFVGGCMLTFFGVFLITSGRPRHDHDEDFLAEQEGVEETIGLSAQEPTTPQIPVQTSRRASESTRSRRSSRASRVNFAQFTDALNKPLRALRESGLPILRIPAAPNSKMSLGTERAEGSPLLANAWQDAESENDQAQPQQRPGIGIHTLSSESIPTVASDFHPGTPQRREQRQQIPERPVTPTTRVPGPSTSVSRPHSHVYDKPMISPSPFSSTVSAVVADKLLPHMTDNPSRKMGHRRSRPGLRNSLFVPQDELDDELDSEVVSAVEEQHQQQRYRRSGYSSAEGWESEAEGQAEQQQRHKGFRGRARSLSNTLGELFGVKRKRRNTAASDEDEDDFLVQCHSPRRRPPAEGSTETF